MSKAAPDLPQRFPFRLVERVDAVTGNRVGVVLGTANGALAPATGWPVTLLAEALAQAILLVETPPRAGTLRLVALDDVVLHGRRATVVRDE